MIGTPVTLPQPCAVNCNRAVLPGPSRDEEWSARIGFAVGSVWADDTGHQRKSVARSNVRPLVRALADR
jgi:hypothetical protein